MGAPKQKWTAEEEAALRAGVVKHGAGKWRTILKDPEFSSVLNLRSNVDLKDKWRNMSVMSNGCGNRDKSRFSLRRGSHVPRHDALSTLVQSDEEIIDVKPLQIDHPRKTNLRWENLILEAIATLDELGGSTKTAIATFLEEQYLVPSNFERLLSAALKMLTSSMKLIKVNHRYRIPQSPAMSEKRSSSLLLLEGRHRVDEDFSMPTKSQIDLELSKMRSMSPEEAAALAARAVTEAEAAIAEAEEAQREAEAAEADAEAAQAFADAAKKTLKGRSTQKMGSVNFEGHRSIYAAN